MISAIKLERYMTGTGIFGIIVSKLRYEKKPYPIILLEVDKGSKISFYYTILPLNLAIYLWVENNRESLLDAEEIA